MISNTRLWTGHESRSFKNEAEAIGLKGLKTELMEHQKNAFIKLKDIQACALFMDMGTGKTRTTLEFVQYRKKSNKIKNVLWICPINTKKNLEKDIKKHSFFCIADIEKYGNEDICVVGIESISRSDRIYNMVYCFAKKYKNDFMLVVDESHMIKNRKAKRTERIINISKFAKYKLILTGTPITNGVWDLYTQMYILHPGILGYKSFYDFAKRHLEYSKKYPGMIIGSRKIEYITQKINPYIYQVTKKECLDLPLKNYQNRYLYMSKEQRKIYNSVKEYFLNKINLEEFDSFIIFNMIGYLHRICSGYIDATFIDYDPLKEQEMITRFQFKTNDKAKAVVQELNHMPPDAKKIIWYRYNSDLELLQEVLQENHIVLSGKIKQKKREESIDHFINGDINIALININIGGTGLNLQKSNYMIYYNNTYDYTKRTQSEDRVYKIGQDKNVHIIDILYHSSVDERIDYSIRKKSSLIRDLRERINEIKDNEEEIKKFKETILNEW